ncbi:MAG: hypothetical protein KF852_03595 [Saprospiraceae bacterium]|nr:hypothetical protein [Saprospiraceae bacterium]
MISDKIKGNIVSSTEIVNLVKSLSLSERLMIIEAILKNIREENESRSKANPIKNGNSPEADILSMAGIFDEEEAAVFHSAVKEARNIANRCYI